MSATCLPDQAELVAERTTQPVEITRGQIWLDLALRCWSRVRVLLRAQPAPKKQLRVCETASLGEKRFVAVVQVGEERFLIGGAAGSVAMLSRLADVPSFPSIPNADFSEVNGPQQ